MVTALGTQSVPRKVSTNPAAVERKRGIQFASGFPPILASALNITLAQRKLHSLSRQEWPIRNACMAHKEICANFAGNLANLDHVGSKGMCNSPASIPKYPALTILSSANWRKAGSRTRAIVIWFWGSMYTASVLNPKPNFGLAQ